MIHDGITRPGSAVANGIAPSVMNENPKIQFVTPARRSSSVYLFLKNAVPIAVANGGTISTAAILMAAVMVGGMVPPFAVANGGTIPPTITAAIKIAAVVDLGSLAKAPEANT